MSDENQNLSLGDAAARFLASLQYEEKRVSQQEVYRFVRWYGKGRTLAELTVFEIANYAEHLSSSDTNYEKKLGLVQDFLTYAKKQGWSKSNLVAHLKVKKGRARLQPSFRRGSLETISLTEEGYATLKDELATLKSKRSESIDEVRRAAADKDFRENAPLQAAREQRGHLEGQIKELEAVLKSAVVIDEDHGVALKVSVGDSIVLRDLSSDEELRYIMVSPREVDPTKGKISSASPLGKAVIGRAQGEVVEVTAPMGKLSYRIEQIVH